MSTPTIPNDAWPLKPSPRYNQTSLPSALLDRHQLKLGCWAKLHVHEGRVRFIDLEHDDEHLLVSPATRVIAPESPHKLRLDGPVVVHIDFFTQNAADQRGAGEARS